jgi:ribosomal protein L32
MRVCPHCGFAEAPIWLKMPYRRFTDYCYKDNFSEWEPEIWKQLQVVKVCTTIQVNDYRYILSKAGYVKRIHKISFPCVSHRWRKHELC